MLSWQRVHQETDPQQMVLLRKVDCIQAEPGVTPSLWSLLHAIAYCLFIFFETALSKMEQNRHVAELAERWEGLPAAGQPCSHKNLHCGCLLWHHSIPGHQCKSIQYASCFPAL